jgi:GTP-binding protein YchF
MLRGQQRRLVSACGGAGRGEREARRMGFNCGIVGLPNVGKSTLFNALTETAAAQAANYPFCTIEPNVGRVAVPDPRLETLAGIGKSQKIVPTSLEFVDIAGLVRGASKGEGLGNQFLANIREVDAIIHVLRCFEDGDITHVEGSVDPIRDAETVETELMLADLDSLEKRQQGLVKRARGGDKEAQAQMSLIEPILAALQAGRPARTAIPAGEEEAARRLQLMTTRPVLYVCNVEEASAATGNKHSARVQARAMAEGAQSVIVSAAIEAEISQMPVGDRAEFLASLGLEDSGLDRIIRAGYALLGLVTYFTVGPKEARAWTITKGTKAPQAAGVIHGDFERGFIAAETIAYVDYVGLGGEQGAKEAGKMRVEGKEYVVKDGDVLLFRFNV